MDTGYTEFESFYMEPKPIYDDLNYRTKWQGGLRSYSERIRRSHIHTNRLEYLHQDTATANFDSISHKSASNIYEDLDNIQVVSSNAITSGPAASLSSREVKEYLKISRNVKEPKEFIHCKIQRKTCIIMLIILGVMMALALIFGMVYEFYFKSTVTQSSSTTSSTSTQTTTSTIPTSTKTTTLTSTSTTTMTTPSTTNQTTMYTNPTTQSIPSTSSTTPSITTPAVTIGPTDTCDTITCLNGGSCDAMQTPVVCNCIDGYEGNICERDIDECASNPCKHGGTCSDMVNDYTCQCATCGCADIEAGTNCETDVSGCRGQETGFFYHPDSCSQYMECAASTPYTKLCADGLVFYTDDPPRCDHPSPDHTCAQTTTAAPTTTTRQLCEESQCDHGSCSTTDRTMCVCDMGYIGDKCETDRVLCADLNCMNGASCNDTDTTIHAFCQCTELYTGNECQTEKDPCDPDPCKNGADCVRGEGIEYTCKCGYSCQCANEFNKKCAYDVETCTDVPNGIYPHPRNCSWYVACNSNTWSEIDCNRNPNSTTYLVYDHRSKTCNFPKAVPCATDDPVTAPLSTTTARQTCANTICENGGSCDDSNTKTHATCNCTEQYTGSNCDTVYNPCASEPCLNNGICTPNGVDYTCQCTYGCSCANDPSIAGQNCENNLETCTGSPNGQSIYGPDCTKFLNCWNSVGGVTACSGNLIFDPSLGRCETSPSCYVTPSP